MSEGAAPAEHPKSGTTVNSGEGRALGTAIAVLVPTGLLTTIIYYFGYRSAKSFYGYFGISLSELDLSSTQYFAFTADIAFRPIATSLLAAFVIFSAHQFLRHAVLGKRLERARTMAWALIVVSAVLAAIGLVGLYGGRGGAPSALAFASAVALSEYAMWLGTQCDGLRAGFAELVRSGVEVRRGIMLALFLAFVFWAVTDLAFERGHERARLIEASLAFQAQAVVYSEKDLHLPGPGVTPTRLEQPEGAFTYRYNGLRQLLYSRDRWFLLPKGWTHANGSTVIVLHDDPGHVRVDLAPGGLDLIQSETQSS